MVSGPSIFWQGSNANSLPGKQWHTPRTAFRPRAGNSTFEKRSEERKAMATIKAKEKEMKEEKEAERQVRCPITITYFILALHDEDGT
jgi:hypothetical protein